MAPDGRLHLPGIGRSGKGHCDMRPQDGVVEVTCSGGQIGQLSKRFVLAFFRLTII
jgi:hypothetical protein